MDGIANQSLFAFNVRGPLGKTSVNRAITASIQDQTTHKFFPLFHNGITVIAKKVEPAKDRLDIEDYFVVNGCQSLHALYRNSKYLSNDLRVLTKFISIDTQSALAKQVTEFSNNQNEVGLRDFMANDAIQLRLQNEFRKYYAGIYDLNIKQGEMQAPGAVLSNELAGIYLIAFEDKEPWKTHRSYQVFKNKYMDLFGKVRADKIVMCHEIGEAITEVIPKITNSLLARYKLTKYLLMYLVREIMETDPLGMKMIERPEDFVRDEAARKAFRQCVLQILGDTVVDLNQHVAEYGENFDYRDKLRSDKWVKEAKVEIVGLRLKLVNRKTLPTLTQQWQKLMTEKAVVGK
jgi:hypothetical protein